MEQEGAVGLVVTGTCPCCGVAKLPHAGDCTLAEDCPDGAMLWGAFANLREKVERHKLTGSERAGIAIVADWAAEHLGEDDPGVVSLFAWLRRTEDKEETNA